MTPVAFRRVAAGLAIAAVLVAVGWLRWPGELPFGSDNDEYLMVAERLRSFDSPLVAGVEGTKYPLGYPALLAVIGWLGLPVAGTALVVNVVAVVGTVALAAATSRRLWGGLAAFAAAGYVAANAGLWASAYSVMPDALLTLAVAAIVWVAVALDGRRRLTWLCVLVGVAAALKSVGLAIGLGVAIGLLLSGRREDRDVRRWVWAPALVAVGVTGLMALSVADLPDHTTGYAETFWRDNPYDASKGEVGVAGVGERFWTELDEGLRDIGWAVAGPGAAVGVAQVLALVMVPLGVLALGRARVLMAIVVVLYVAALIVWPFESIRFGLPLVPVAAAGVGFVLSRVRRRAASVGVAVAALAAFGVWSAVDAERDADTEGTRLAAFHAAADDFAEWAGSNVGPGEDIASPDYRELARRLDRSVLSVGYTSDASELWEATAGRGAEWFVFVHELVPRRVNIARHLLGSYPGRFEPAYENDLIEVYRIMTE